MNKALLSAAVAGLLATTTAGMAHADDANAGKVKCYGIAKAGKNDCKAADSAHSCQGQSTRDNNPNDWNFTAKDACESAGGSLEAGKTMSK